MPAVSKAQQHLMGMVHAAQKGEEPASPEVAKIAKTIKPDAAKDYASTKTKDLPAHKLKEAIRKIYREYSRECLMSESLTEDFNDTFVLWANKITNNLPKAIQRAKYIGKGGTWSSAYKTNAIDGRGTTFFVKANSVSEAKEKIQNLINSDKNESNIYYV